MTKVNQINGFPITSLLSFEESEGILHVSLNIENAKANMQTDESAFEAWTICLKVWNNYKTVFIDISDKEKWDEITPQIRQFLYRIKKFNENYSWCQLSNMTKELIEIHDVVISGKALVLNHPQQEATQKAMHVEAQLERRFVAENRKSFDAMSTQMPLGIFDNVVSEKTRLLPTSFLDIWSFDGKTKTLSIYELKAKGNKSVGIISELMYYCNIINDRACGNIKHTDAANKFNVRGLKLFLQALESKPIIKGVFLTDELHPLIQYKKDKIKSLIDTTSVIFEFQEYKDDISKGNNFKESERERQERLISNPDVFYHANGGGYYKNQYRTFCLKRGDENNNVFDGVQEGVKAYFKENDISFWGNSKIIPNHILSSQVSCLNHLFAVRHEHEIVTTIVREITGNTDILGVERILCDKNNSQHIAFEVVSDDDYLNEIGNSKFLSRGEYCTSIDAVIVAKTVRGNLLVSIEWKYTESYCRDDKSIEDGLNKPFEKESKGKERLRRYTHLIDQSDYLVSLGEEEYRGSIYYQEPFYQLMRQTLWSEQMLKHKDVERIKAVDYVHVHVVPQKNGSLLQQGYEWGETMESAWMSHLTDKGKERYKIVSPETIVDAIEKADKDKNYVKLIKYLRTRYNYDK